VLSTTAPDAALQAKPPQDHEPGDDNKLRQLAFRFVVVPAQAAQAPVPAKAPPQNPKQNPAQSSAEESGSLDLLQLFLSSDHGLVVALLLAGLIGGIHALTPGHGKTLVAAYLVGQRGTVGHALILGVVTTVTHTGVVLAIALGLLFVSEEARQQVANALGLVMGLALVCLGVWLFLQRLAGRADHFHIGGHGHHHHGHHHHHHAPVQQEATRATSARQRDIAFRDVPPASAAGKEIESLVNQPKKLGWYGLIVMGATGGIAPCWDAVAMLVLAIGMNLLWLAVPMLLAFSAGLAAVLVLIGVMVVHARRLLDSRWSESRAVRLLPILSALFITAMGVLVCFQGTQSADHHAKNGSPTSRP
jgi:ABC-type nickel/cobalt efflux system permease component RcnA